MGLAGCMSHTQIAVQLCAYDSDDAPLFAMRGLPSVSTLPAGRVARAGFLTTEF
jgi:hypothetical protein